jgi:hypothetical protein
MRRLMAGVVSVGLLAALGVFVVQLLRAPLYERFSATECREAYGRARTLADSIRVDMHPYASPKGGGNARCGELGIRSASLSDALVGR